VHRNFRSWMGRFGVALALALMAATAVLAQDVTANYLPGRDFSKYKTYKWVPIEGGAHPNQIVDIEIRMSVDTQLAHKGLAKMDSNSVDLYVGYQAAVAQDKQWSGYGTGGGLRWNTEIAAATSSTINAGTLVLDFYDTATKQLVWTGRVSKTFNPNDSPEKQQKNLDKAVEKLLRKFPPQAN
jgi:Domain of unknown function (DUF4136)